MGGAMCAWMLVRGGSVVKSKVENVRFSVIVPVYNASALLARCLQSLAASEFRDYECIVVDDASTDDSRAVAGRFGCRLVALEENGGPARARNRGADGAQGEILAFIDSDVCVHPDTLSRLDAHFSAHPSADAVIGSYDDTPADQGFVSQYKNLFHHYVHQRSRPEAGTFWAGCGAVRRQVFLQVGGFDESYRRPSIEDIELGYRLRANGHAIDLDPQIQVTHLKKWTFWGLVRTDLRDRGIPWFLLMLQHRTMPSDLNVTMAHRASVALVFAIALLCALVLAQQLPMVSIQMPSWRWVGGGLIGLVALLVALNLDLYRFFTRQRGVVFAVCVLPLHWVYYAYCGAAVAIGLSAYLWGRLAAPRDARRFPALPGN
jgi:glycosyltransferase involved in cell wall biosynthesis